MAMWPSAPGKQLTLPIGIPVLWHSSNLEFHARGITQAHTWYTTTLEFHARITADGDAHLRGRTWLCTSYGLQVTTPAKTRRLPTLLSRPCITMHHPDTHDARPHDVQPVETTVGLAAFAEAIDDDAFAKALFELTLCILEFLLIGLWC
ncbi:hypothetical protein IG631_22537 [Alternaria alternata]|jgi:hypothetical protein|nr:hypothetical protein IG631_22537 [Alternaria alternata]